MKTCDYCQHFRQPKPMSELMAAETASGEKPVLDALQKIQEQERSLLNAELAQKKDQMLRDSAEWPLQRAPFMSDYCGVGENRNIFYIRDLKNAGQRCPDHRAGVSPSRSCQTCQHRAAPFGRERDLNLAQLYMTSVAVAARYNMFQGAAEEQLKQHMNACAQATANQISAAFASGGFMPARPEYLSVCRQLSEQGRSYAICSVVNASSACRLWEPLPHSTDPNALVIELYDGQLDWTPVPPYELLLEGSTLRLKTPDPDFGPAKMVQYDLRKAPRDGACRLAAMDGTPLPLRVRYYRMIAYVKVGPVPEQPVYQALFPEDTAPRRFRPKQEGYYPHPNPKLSLSVRLCGNSLLIYNGIGPATHVDLTKVPRNQWVSPDSRGLRFPVRIRLGYLESMFGAYVPEVEWLD